MAGPAPSATEVPGLQCGNSRMRQGGQRPGRMSAEQTKLNNS